MTLTIIIKKDGNSKKFYNIKDFYCNETVLNFSCIDGFFDDKISISYKMEEIETFNFYKVKERINQNEL